ncbi:MAG: DUF5107 domain-containing protein [Balneolaceae bacterium]
MDRVIEKVSVSIRNEVIPTYEPKPADPTPIFYNGRRYAGAQGRVYPYALRNELTDKKEDKEYELVVLENQYVKIVVLPEIGGKIYSAINKSNGYKYVYHNQVIKPGLIGVAGAWTSGGVEWNAPHVHRITTFTPVDYSITEQEDGSKTVWVGETEWRHRSKWIVGMTLHPDSSLLHITKKLFNPNPYPLSVLGFVNAAVHTNEEYQLIFPPKTQYATYHQKNHLSQWPESRQFFGGMDCREGVDLSWWKNHDQCPLSIFEWGNMGNFVAGIDHGQKAGTVLFGNEHVNPGKKFWSWGKGRKGAIVDTELLTDDDGPYMELMLGNYSDNQPDYCWLQPLETKEATFFMAPINGMSNLHEVNENGMVSLDVQGDAIRLEVAVHRPVRGSMVRLMSNEEVLYENEAHLTPTAPFVHELDLIEGEVDTNNLSIHVEDHEGKELVHYHPERVEKYRPFRPTRKPQRIENIQDADQLYAEGVFFEQFHDSYYDPENYYRKAVELRPNHAPSLMRLGILALKIGEHESAFRYLEAAVKPDVIHYKSPENGQAMYYFALACKELGREGQAYDHFYRASWDYGYHSASHFQMAMLMSRKKNVKKARSHLEQAAIHNTRSLPVLSFLATLSRIMDEPGQSEEYISKTLDVDPLNAQAHYERFLLLDNPTDLEEFIRLMRGQPNSYLELAIGYMHFGLLEDAISILRLGENDESGTLTEDPIVHYQLGYCYHQLGEVQRAKESFQRAGSLSIESVFPFRFETVAALQLALQYNSTDYKAWYYIGCILYDHQPAQAVQAWGSAMTLDEQLPMLHRNLAFAYANVNEVQDSTKAFRHLEKAIELNHENIRFHLEYVDYCDRFKKDTDSIRKHICKYYSQFRHSNEGRYRIMELDLHEKYHASAISTMKGDYTFYRLEAARTIYPYWVYANTTLALYRWNQGSNEFVFNYLTQALSYPKHLQEGQSEYEVIPLYYLGCQAILLGEESKANEYFDRVLTVECFEPDCIYYKNKTLERTGNVKVATQGYLRLIQLGKQHLAMDTEDCFEFFHPFAPILNKNQIQSQAYHKMALGYLGLGREVKAYKLYESAKEIRPMTYSLPFDMHYPQYKGKSVIAKMISNIRSVKEKSFLPPIHLHLPRT